MIIMWDKEVIFSTGDLSDSEYLDFIAQNYNGKFKQRFEHIESMIDRLVVEREYILMLCCNVFNEYIDESRCKNESVENPQNQQAQD